MSEQVKKIVTVRDLKLRLDLIPDDFNIVLMTSSNHQFALDQLLTFIKEREAWLTVDEDGFEEEDPELEGDPTCQAGDMCTLPEVSGDTVPQVDMCEKIGRGKVKRA